ncbi:hypothetical protein IFM89_027276 [Coptis chinensis]|uniref:Uncharacterized protein n=1 Tax=Coptis chinensis TaxID=261450 RepID=A0A835LP03_9MAGN|nr:hypothetical protein IFM89_027276 [Coptis chinensis]
MMLHKHLLHVQVRHQLLGVLLVDYNNLSMRQPSHSASITQRQVDQTPPRPPDKAKERWADIQEDDTETTHAGKFALLTSSFRGIANAKTQNRLSKLIKEWDPDLLGIAEPKIDSNAISKSYIQSLGLCVTFFCNSNNQQLPNIWLLWKEGFSAPNLIHRLIKKPTIECNGSIVTMDNDYTRQQNKQKFKHAKTDKPKKGKEHKSKQTHTDEAAHLAEANALKGSFWDPEKFPEITVEDLQEFDKANGLADFD